MGCWNGTCLISNLPIKYDEPIVGYTVEYRDEKDYYRNAYSGSCYSSGWATPFGLPFYGKYNDYGGIESVDDNSLSIKYLLHMFNEIDSEKLLREIERDVKTIVRHRAYKKDGAGVGLVMINRNIFDRLIDSYVPNEYNEDFNVKSIVNKFQKIREFELKRKRMYAEYKNGNLSKDDIEKLLGFISLPRQLGLSVDSLEEIDYSSMIKFVLNQDYSEKIANEFAELLYKDQIIRGSMEALRKLWIGQAGKGSQNADYRTHLVLADAIKDHIFSSFDGPEDAYSTILG